MHLHLVPNLTPALFLMVFVRALGHENLLKIKYGITSKYRTFEVFHTSRNKFEEVQ